MEHDMLSALVKRASPSLRRRINLLFHCMCRRSDDDGGPLCLPEDAVTILLYFTVTGRFLFVCGKGGALFRSADRGLNWRTLTTGLTNDLSSVAAHHTGVVACCGKSGAIGLSINKGQAFENRSVSGANLSTIAVSPRGRWIVAGGTGAVYVAKRESTAVVAYTDFAKVEVTLPDAITPTGQNNEVSDTTTTPNDKPEDENLKRVNDILAKIAAARKSSSALSAANDDGPSKSRKMLLSDTRKASGGRQDGASDRPTFYNISFIDEDECVLTANSILVIFDLRNGTVKDVLRHKEGDIRQLLALPRRNARSYRGVPVEFVAYGAAGSMVPYDYTCTVAFPLDGSPSQRKGKDGDTITFKRVQHCSFVQTSPHEGCGLCLLANPLSSSAYILLRSNAAGVSQSTDGGDTWDLPQHAHATNVAKYDDFSAVSCCNNRAVFVYDIKDNSKASTKNAKLWTLRTLPSSLRAPMLTQVAVMH